jgi:hypothetical protein
MSDVNFADLIPDAIRVNNLPDGSTLVMLRRESFDQEEMAQMTAIQNRVLDLGKQLERAGNDQARRTILSKLGEAQDELLKTIAPTVTAETLASLKMGQKSAIMTYWSKAHAEAEPGN